MIVYPANPSILHILMLTTPPSATMPRDGRYENGDAVPVVGAERVAAGAGGGGLRRLHVRAVRAAERGVRYTRSRRQAGGTNAAALADGAAGDASATDRCPAHNDRRASDGYRAPALAHGTTGNRAGAAAASISTDADRSTTHSDASTAPANAAGADCDRAAAAGHS